MKRVAGSLFLLLLAAGHAGAQERVIIEADLPRAVTSRLLAIARDSATTRYAASARIAPGEAVMSDVLLADGILTVAGAVHGDVVVLNGDVAFEPGGTVSGDLTVIGGAVTGAENGAIAGTTTIYSEGVRIALSDTRRDDVDDDDPHHEDDDDHWDRRRGRRGGDRGREWSSPRHFDLGGSDISLGVAESYNRVEGLPLEIGPSIRTNGPNPLRIDARAILRTQRGSTPKLDQYGYNLKVQQSLGGRDELRIGASATSAVTPIEQWQVSDSESSLATLLFHYDPRDHYERTGWGAFVHVQPERAPVELTVEFRDDDYRSVGAADPFTLFGDDWRLQPLVAEGSLRSLSGRIAVDTRDDRKRATDGVFVTANVLRGLSGDLAIPAFTHSESSLVLPAERPVAADFTSGLVDARLYARVGGEGGLALRLVGGGSLDGRELAPQFQHAFGGPGGVAAFGLREADCGAGGSSGFLPAGGQAPEFLTFYGCDRFGMLQAEYRGGFRFGWHDGWDDDDWDDDDSDWSYHQFDIDIEPNWVIFADAGRGWAYGENRPEAKDTKTIADAGFGLMLGDLGIYWAVPITGDRRGANFFVRLGQRF